MDNFVYKLEIEDGVTRKSAEYNGKGIFTIGTGPMSSFSSTNAAVLKQAELTVVKNQLRLNAFGPRGVDILVQRGTVLDRVDKKIPFKVKTHDAFFLTKELRFRIVFESKIPAPTTTTSTSSSVTSLNNTTSTTSTSTSLPSSSIPASSSSSASSMGSGTSSTPRPPPLKPSAPPVAASPATAVFSTPKLSRKVYPARYLNPDTPQPRPFPFVVEPVTVLEGADFVPIMGANNLAVLFHNPITKDQIRERREINDIVLFLKCWGFKVEVVEEATYDKCQRTIDARLAKMKADGEVIDTFCIFVASHGIDNSSKRLSIQMFDKSLLDSAQLSTWAFDFKAKNTFIIILTCHAENGVHGVNWPDSTRGGIIWASSRNKTADLRSFSVRYPNGSQNTEVHDVFVRSAIELMFCLVDVTELEYNISFSSFCSLLRSATSTADRGSSFGSESFWNGHEVPLRFLDYDARQLLLQLGCTALRVELKAGVITWIPFVIPGRVSAGSTDLTRLLQCQIDKRTAWEDVPTNPTVIDLTAHRAALNMSSEHNDENNNDLRAETDSTTSGDAHSLENRVEESVDSEVHLRSNKEQLDNDDTAQLNQEKSHPTNMTETPDSKSQKALEQKIIRKFNSENNWKCRNKCSRCFRRLISPDHRTNDDDWILFRKLSVKYYNLAGYKAAKTCGATCPD